MRAPLVFIVLLAGLSGCDQLGIESTAAAASRRDAEGKAVGGGCRHAARSVEQCYEQNKRADKAAVFAGWREMNDYMRENKIEPQPPAVEVAAADGAESSDGEPRSDARPDRKSDNKGTDKSDDKGKAGKAARTAK